MGTQETKKAGAKIISQKIKLYSLNCKGRKILMQDPRSCHMLFEDVTYRQFLKNLYVTSLYYHL